MPITYEGARELVRRTVRPSGETGTFCLDDRKIIENDDMYVFEVGAREHIVDGDDDFEIVGGVPVVYKEDGRLAWLSSIQTAYDDSLRIRENPNPTLQV